MPKITGGVIAAIVAGAVVLGGAGIGTAIAINQDDEPAAGPSPSISESADTAEADETAGPLVAESPSPTASSDADTAFLAYVRADLLPTSGITNARDIDLIAAGHLACEQIRSGVKLEDLRLVEGEQPAPSGSYYDTSAIFNGALVNYCPELMEPPSNNDD